MISIYIVLRKKGDCKLEMIDAFESLIEASSFLLGYQRASGETELFIQFRDRQTIETLKDLKEKCAFQNV